MDLRALEYTRAHYDKHSNQVRGALLGPLPTALLPTGQAHPPAVALLSLPPATLRSSAPCATLPGQYASTEEALRARAQGPGAPLKKFHNDIKRQLISRFASNAGSLLDFACGRGGDIWKWIDAGVQRVKGIDLSPGEIEEARTRFEEARAKRPEMELDYEFVDSPMLGVSEWREDRQYDVVTCMFAIHYFFVTEKALKQVGGPAAVDTSSTASCWCCKGSQPMLIKGLGVLLRAALHLPVLTWPSALSNTLVLALAHACAVPAQRVHQPEGGRLLHRHRARRQAHQ
jgi:SAM-dependent methyltransferase